MGFRLGRGLKPSYYLRESEGEHGKAKFRQKSYHDTLLTFALIYSEPNRILESPYLISAILGTLIRYGLLNCN